MNIINNVVLASVFSGISLSVTAAPIVLADSISCNLGAPLNGIAVTDVTGNSGGSTNCWGTFDGNDPGPSGDGFDIDGTTFDFIAKQEGGALEGTDIGLNVIGIGSATGTWSYDSSKFAPTEFLIVLKAANNPGYAAWLFSGPDVASDAGDWAVAWTNNNGKPRDLSHLSVYSSSVVPVPAAVWLFGSGLIGLIGIARRKQSFVS